MSGARTRRTDAGAMTRAGGGPGNYGRFGGTLYLAREELRSARWSFISGLAASLALGVAAAILASLSLRTPGAPGSAAGFALDFAFLLAVGYSHSPRMWTVSMKPIYEKHLSRRLSFLKTLPVREGEISAALALSKALAVAGFAAAFFVPLSVTGAEVGLGVLEYLSFVALWVGCALALGGVSLYLELRFGDKVSFTMFCVIFAVLGAGLGMTYGAVLGGGSKAGVVLRVAEFVAGGGAYAGPVSLLSGAALLAALTALAARGLRKRELSE